jgi:hypothetical protein
MNLTYRKTDGLLIRKPGEQIYYNISIPHNSTDGSPSVAEFSEIRSTPLFYGRPKDFTLAVVRFNIPTSEIPIQIIPIDKQSTYPAPDPLLISLYTITLQLGPNIQQVPILWESQRPLAQAPILLDNVNGLAYVEYYSLYSIQHLCDLINTALQTAYNILELQTGAGISGPPFMMYDAVTHLITLYVPEDYVGLGVNIWMNHFLHRNFANSFIGDVINYNDPDGRDFVFRFKDDGTNIQQITRPPAPVTNYIVNTQEEVTIASLSSFQSLVLTTASLPIRNEWITQQAFREPGQFDIVQQTASNSFFGVLADFEVDLGDGFELGTSIHYNPTAEFRRITMTADTPITRIDLKVYWRDSYDRLIPLLLPSHKILTVKLLFEKK